MRALPAEVERGPDRALELVQSAQGEETLEILLALAGGEHACEVVEGSDLGAHALAQVLAAGATAEVVVALRPFGGGDELELACPRPVGDHLLAPRDPLRQRGLPGVARPRLKLLQGGLHPLEVLLAQGGGEV